MEIEWLSYFLILLVLIISSALFSGAEVALFSLDKKRVEKVKSNNKLLGGYIQNLIENPKKLLVTILFGNTIFNVGASILSVTVAISIADKLNIDTEIALLAQIIILTVLLLVFSEISPKIIASKHPVFFSKLIAFPLYWFGEITYPVGRLLSVLLGSLSSKIKLDRSKTALHSSEISDLADLSKEKGAIEEEEHELIHSIYNFKSVISREVMTPRVDIVAVSIDTTFEELLEIINESGHSRLPLYNSDLDDIIGVIYAKDLLPYIKNKEARNNFSLRKIARKPFFIPETKLISELMKEFQQKNLHLGIVVDEYGGTSGLISLEDILEEIVGEIRDEYDDEETEITKLDENKYLVLGKVTIDELYEEINKDFSSESDDYDTIGGFIFNHAGTIPKEGFSFEYNNVKFTVKEVENNRINKVLIELNEN